MRMVPVIQHIVITVVPFARTCSEKQKKDNAHSQEQLPKISIDQMLKSLQVGGSHFLVPSTMLSSFQMTKA